ncbi:MAG: hypothetical protein NVS2B7_02890 [Herpetosiphon sp.]
MLITCHLMMVLDGGSNMPLTAGIMDRYSSLPPTEVSDCRATLMVQLAGFRAQVKKNL